MVQRVKGLLTRPGDLSSVPGTHVKAEGREQKVIPHVYHGMYAVLWSPHVCHGVCMQKGALVSTCMSRYACCTLVLTCMSWYVCCALAPTCMSRYVCVLCSGPHIYVTVYVCMLCSGLHMHVMVCLSVCMHTYISTYIVMYVY